MNENKSYKEKLMQLYKYYQNDPETLEDIENAIDSFLKYHNSRINHEIKTYTAREIAKDRQDYIQIIKDADSSRTYAHDAAIINLRILNKIYQEANLGNFTPKLNTDSKYNKEEINRQERQITATFVKDFVNEFYGENENEREYTPPSFQNFHNSGPIISALKNGNNNPNNEHNLER